MSTGRTDIVPVERRAKARRAQKMERCAALESC